MQAIVLQSFTVSALTKDDTTFNVGDVIEIQKNPGFGKSPTSYTVLVGSIRTTSFNEDAHSNDFRLVDSVSL